MNNYQTKQLKLIQRIEAGFKKGKSILTIVKPVSDYVKDNRICLTSVVFIPQNLEKRIIKEIISPLQKIDPSQYFYIPRSLHITMQNIRTIEDPPLFNKKDVKKAKVVFKEVISKYSSFTFSLKRLFELPTSLALCAFSDETFGKIVLELRNKLKKAGVPDNKTYADKRIVIGSMTIARFTDVPNKAFYEKIKKLKEIEIGEFKVRKISLITTNAACHPTKTKIIKEYFLKDQ